MSPESTTGAGVNTIQQETSALTRLALPVVITQLGNMMLWVVDVVMVGAVGYEELGAASLGRLMVMGVMMFGMGVVLGIDPLITQAHGAGDGERTGQALQSGLFMAILVSIPIGVVWVFTGPILAWTGQDPGLSAMAHDYVLVQLPLIPFFLLFTVLRQYLQGRTIVYPTMIVVFLGNVVNILANWVLIFGKFGFPELGLIGAGIATSVTQGCMLAGLVAWVRLGRLHIGAWGGWNRSAWRWPRLREVINFGIPVAFQISLEMWAFVAAALLAGWIGKVELAAHTIVINIASVSFMVPLGISFAAVTRVGNLIGERDNRGAQRAAWVAFAMGGGVMISFAILFITARYTLPTIYTDEPAVVALAAILLPVAAAFQLFDGVQVVGSGILRGMGQTRPAALFNLVGYYVLALPLAYWLAFPLGMGLTGVWWGLCLGLAVVAILLLGWVAVKGPGKVDSRVV
jgi:MATE family multidrug resistance protein